MKVLILFFCLAQLWGCRAVPHGPILGYREPACDDVETEQAALAAVDYINKHLPRGYKHTLNQVDSVKVWPRVSEPAMGGRRAQLGASKSPPPSTKETAVPKEEQTI